MLFTQQVVNLYGTHNPWRWHKLNIGIDSGRVWKCLWMTSHKRCSGGAGLWAGFCFLWRQPECSQRWSGLSCPSASVLICLMLSASLYRLSDGHLQASLVIPSRRLPFRVLRIFDTSIPHPHPTDILVFFPKLQSLSPLAFLFKMRFIPHISL